MKLLGTKGSNREPPKGDRSRKTANAVNTELSLSRAPSPHSQKDSGAIPKINFVSQNIYTPLRNLRDLGDDTFSWGGKKKATPPLEQTSPKKAREATPLNARKNDGSSGDVTVTPDDVSEKETASGTPHFPDKSAITIKAWNVQRGLERKLKDNSFLSILKSCEIAVLSECWLTDNFDASEYELDAYKIIALKRSKCRGGGICILIKKRLEQKVSLIKQSEDSLIWLKLDSSLFTDGTHMYLCCAYIPPEGNKYYNYYDCDLFDLLESDLELYSGFAKVGVIGDLNTRLGLLDDIIRNDDVHQTLIDNMESLFLYPRDDLFVERNSKDNHVNNHGRKFITLCKESGLRIINGRTKSDQYGDITFQNIQGTSVIDIACIHYSSFNIVKDFAVEEFTEFSDHAPICLSLKVCAADGDNICTCAQRSDTYVSWNSGAAEQLYQCILVNRDSLAACAENI